MRIQSLYTLKKMASFILNVQQGEYIRHSLDLGTFSINLSATFFYRVLHLRANWRNHR